MAKSALGNGGEMGEGARDFRFNEPLKEEGREQTNVSSGDKKGKLWKTMLKVSDVIEENRII